MWGGFRSDPIIKCGRGRKAEGNSLVTGFSKTQRPVDKYFDTYTFHYLSFNVHVHFICLVGFFPSRGYFTHIETPPLLLSKI